MKKILTILATLCTALSGLLQWRRSRHREAISEAIHSGDTETVTKHHHHLLKVLAVSGIIVAAAKAAAKRVIGTNAQEEVKE